MCATYVSAASPSIADHSHFSHWIKLRTMDFEQIVHSCGESCLRCAHAPPIVLTFCCLIYSPLGGSCDVYGDASVGLGPSPPKKPQLYVFGRWKGGLKWLQLTNRVSCHTWILTTVTGPYSQTWRKNPGGFWGQTHPHTLLSGAYARTETLGNSEPIILLILCIRFIETWSRESAFFTASLGLEQEATRTVW